MAQKKIEAEIESWMEDIPDELQEAFLEMVDIDKESISMTLGENEHAFTVNYSKDYPNDCTFSVSSEDPDLFQWVEMINEYASRMPKLKIATLLEEMALRFTNLQGMDQDDDEMEGIDLRQSQGGFDTVVGSALAKEAKKRVQDLAKTAQDQGCNVGFVDYDESVSIIRAAVPMDHLNEVTAKVWGVNRNMPIVVELRFQLENMSKPPAFSLCQSSDPNMANFKLKDIHSFGLEWQLRARLDDWLNGGKETNSKPNWPSKDGDFVTLVVQEILRRVENCTKTCIICDGALPFQMIKPAVCDRNLCVHSHEQYGLGADVASEIRENLPVVDLLISFCYAISQGDHRRFNPYPIGVEAKYVEMVEGMRREHSKHFMEQNDSKAKNLPSVKRVLDLMPAVKDMTKYTDTKSLAAYLETLDPLCFPLLRWIITSNRAHLAKLSKEEMITEAVTEHQYMFLSSPPEKEAKFQELKRSKGSFWAFHGSAFANWHSILRIGLKNYSNTELMSCGAAYGAGIYLSPLSQTSMGYAHAQTGWGNSSFKGTGNLTCLCICEVINDNYKANPHYVIPNEDHVMTRYFLIYNSQYACPALEANKLKNLKSSTIANNTPIEAKKSSSGILKKIIG